MTSLEELLMRLDAAPFRQRFIGTTGGELWRNAAAEIRKLQGQLETECKAHALADKVVIEFQDRFLKERKAREEADSNYIAARHEAMREASICAEALSRAEAAERRLAAVEECKEPAPAAAPTLLQVHVLGAEEAQKYIKKERVNMELPEDLDKYTNMVSTIVRDCAKVCEHLADGGTSPKADYACSEAILSRYGLAAEPNAAAPQEPTLIQSQAGAKPAPAAATVKPVAYVIQSLRDGSIGSDIAPVSYALFDRRMGQLREHSWVKSGIATIIPLYTESAIATARAEGVLEGLEEAAQLASEFASGQNACHVIRAEIDRRKAEGERC